MVLDRSSVPAAKPADGCSARLTSAPCNWTSRTPPRGPIWASCTKAAASRKTHSNATCTPPESKDRSARPSLRRIKFLQTQLANAPATQTTKLPCIEDAWNIPISQEVASRQKALRAAGEGEDATHKKPRLESESGQPLVFLSPHDLQLMQMLQTLPSLTPQQGSMLKQLQHRYQLMSEQKQRSGLPQAADHPPSGHSDLSDARNQIPQVASISSSAPSVTSACVHPQPKTDSSPSGRRCCIRHSTRSIYPKHSAAAPGRGPDRRVRAAEQQRNFQLCPTRC